jgi:hypothetical protein
MNAKAGRTVVLSLVLSAIGFSYALATGGSRSTEQSRALQGAPPLAPLNFTNPFFGATPNRDMGDAVPGGVLRRYVRAKGGIPPYKFTADVLPNALSLGKGGLFTTPVTNKLRPVLPANFATGAVSFMTTVACRGTTDKHTEPFQLNVVSDIRFRFAIGPSLNEAVQFRKYVDKLDVLNPKPPLTYALTGSVLLNGVAQPDLASLGLALTKREGVVYGQPIKSGTITFTVSCTDANGNAALARDGSGPNQTVIIKVDPNTVFATDTLCDTISVKAGKSGTTVTYKGLMNLNGPLSSLAGKPVSVRLGNYSSPEAFFDDTGNATNLIGKNGKATVDGDPTIITAKVSSSGALSITVTNADLGITDALDLPVRRGSSALPDIIGGRSTVVGGDVGDTSIEQTVSVSSSSSSSLSLNGANSAAGAFLVINTVSGRDDRTGAGDRWRVTFVANPPTGTDLTKVTSAQVSVGNLANTLPATARSTSITARAAVTSTTRNAVTSFSLTTKSLKGSYNTTFLDATATGIPVSGTAFSGANPDYPTQVVLTDSAGNPLYAGAGAVTIFPKRNSWTSTAPK